MQIVTLENTSATRLLVILLISVVDDVEEAELVNTLGGRNDAEPITELLLLEELLGAAGPLANIPSFTMSYCNVQVLQVATRELLVGDNLDLAIGLLADLDVVAEVSGAALNLDAVVEELLEGLDVEDLVVDGLRAVDDELVIVSGHLAFRVLGISHLLGHLLSLLGALGGGLLH
jgi:hypothetical protein